LQLEALLLILILQVLQKIVFPEGFQAVPAYHFLKVGWIRFKALESEEGSALADDF